MGSSYTLSLAPAREVGLQRGLQRAWERLLAAQDHVQLMYQSPEWFQYFRRTHPQVPVMLARVESAPGQLEGLVPIWLSRYSLRYNIGTRVLARSDFKCAYIMGGQPLLPPDPRLYDRLFRELWDRLGPEYDCVALSSVAQDSFLWNYLHDSGSLRQYFQLYIPDGLRRRLCIELPASFEDYLGRFSAKTRNTLRRKVRKLERRAEGGLRVLRAETPEQVPEWLAGAAQVHAKSWQSQEVGVLIANTPEQRRKLEEQAAAGLLRSYLLYSGDEPCAFVLGYQYRHIFYYSEVGYDRDFGRYSPSVVLLMKLLQDLMIHRPAQRLDFGLGEQDYKRQFGNSSYVDAPVLLFRRGLHNQLRSWSHAGFRRSVWLAKELLRARR